MSNIKHAFYHRDHSFALRFMITLTAGVIVAGLLTWFMYILIQSGEQRLDESQRLYLPDFVRVKRPERTHTKERLPPKPVENQAPPAPEQAANNSAADNILAVSNMALNVDINMDSGFSFGAGEGEYLPIVKVAPVYPLRAIDRGMEGECLVEYTVTAIGTVTDVKVIEEQCSNQIFYKASVKAALKFKYKPRVVDGQAIEVNGVRNRFFYQLDKVNGD